MTKSELENLMNSLLRVTAFYGVQVQKEIMLMYCEKLAHLPFQSVVEALKKITDDPKINKYNILPISHHVKAILEPAVNPRDEAAEAAARIISAMSRYGYTNPTPARALIGELGWKAVELMGGWTKLCQDTQVSENGVLRAQLRDLCSGLYTKALAGNIDRPPAIPEPTIKKLLPNMGINRAIGPKEEEPDGF